MCDTTRLINTVESSNGHTVSSSSKRFVEKVKLQGLHLTDRQTYQFDQYYQLLIEWNQKINLTAITEEEEVYYKHFYDSLTLAMSYPKVIGSHSIIDIGSGAGFPGIPLKIMFPELNITFLDSLNKRITYLQNVTEAIGLQGCRFVHGRAEEVAHKSEFREVYDFAVARAVAKLAVLNELCLPFVRNNGYFYSMKGPDVSGEMKEASKSLKILKAKITNNAELELPYNYGKRSIIEVQKLANIHMKYPRRPGTPAKDPLI